MEGAEDYNAFLMGNNGSLAQSTNPFQNTSHRRDAQNAMPCHSVSPSLIECQLRNTKNACIEGVGILPNYRERRSSSKRKSRQQAKVRLSSPPPPPPLPLYLQGTVQGLAKRWAPGCVNDAGRPSRSGKQQQEQIPPNLGRAF